MWVLASFRERPFQTESAMGRASGPERRIMAKAPLPEGVANAVMVEVILLRSVAKATPSKRENLRNYWEVWLKPHPVKEKI